MSEGFILGTLRFFPLDSNAPRFFGFGEYLAGLALMVIAWTIADVRYRFRLRATPLPLQRITFAVVAAVGIFSILTDLWQAERWLVPEGNVLSPAGLQAVLGGTFLLTFLSWAWFAFIHPPVYGSMNAVRFARTLYSAILKGSASELAVIADEFARSAKSLVRHATEQEEFTSPREHDASKARPAKRLPKVVAYANDILLLIADKRFCRAIVGSSPGTALALFREIANTKKYGVRVRTFGRNIVNEALLNRDSFLFHESEGYESGLLGYHKPLSQAMFSNYRMVERIGTLLDPDIGHMNTWDSAQWKAYCRVVLITFSDYIEEDFWSHSFVLYRAMGNIEGAAHDLYKIDGFTGTLWDNDVHSRLRVVVGFIKDAVEVLDKKGVPKRLHLRVPKGLAHAQTCYDHLASMIFDVVLSASAVRSPTDQCWWIQHNSVWGELFNFDRLNGLAGRVVKFKVRRLIYDEVSGMKPFPNFKGAAVLRFCLNVMGLSLGDQRYERDSLPLQKAILSWTRKNYVWLHAYNPRVADACLTDGISYDQNNQRLVKTYPVEGLRREPEYHYLSLDRPSSEEKEAGG